MQAVKKMLGIKQKAEQPHPVSPSAAAPAARAPLRAAELKDGPKPDAVLIRRMQEQLRDGTFVYVGRVANAHEPWNPQWRLISVQNRAVVVHWDPIEGHATPEAEARARNSAAWMLGDAAFVAEQLVRRQVDPGADIAPAS